MSLNRLSQYRIMWIFVLFDMPTETKRDRKEAGLFRKKLLMDGFNMFQFSIYIRHCTSRENAKVHEQRVKNMLPPKGKVSILTLTDKQFGMMTMYYGRKEKKPPKQGVQLELF